VNLAERNLAIEVEGDYQFLSCPIGSSHSTLARRFAALTATSAPGGGWT
jgi:hypothetical protein